MMKENGAGRSKGWGEVQRCLFSLFIRECRVRIVRRIGAMPCMHRRGNTRKYGVMSKKVYFLNIIMMKRGIYILISQLIIF